MKDDPIDGRADIVFWGRHEAEIAAEFGATCTGTPGDDHYGWLNLPVRDAYVKAIALNDRRQHRIPGSPSISGHTPTTGR